MKKLSSYITILLVFTFFGCNTGPKVIEAEASAGNSANSPIAKVDGHNHGSEKSISNNSDQHKIVAEEILETDKYTYIRTKEHGKEFWVAIPKSEITVGETYYYKGGLLKKNFFSKEFNRNFETVYLVSQFWKKPIPSDGSGLAEALVENESGELEIKKTKIEAREGSIPLAELIENKDKYGGKTIAVTGKCTKVNPAIMNRNWVHLTDDSKEGIDLTITTNETVKVGDIVTFKGLITLKKDFGAGYSYDIIMEDAVLSN